MNLGKTRNIRCATFKILLVFLTLVGASACKKSTSANNTANQEPQASALSLTYTGLAVSALPPVNPASLTLTATATAASFGGYTFLALAFTNDPNADAVAYTISGPNNFNLQATTALPLKLIANLPTGSLSISIRSCVRPNRSTSTDSSYLVQAPSNMGTFYCNNQATTVAYTNSGVTSASLAQLFTQGQSLAYQIYTKIQSYGAQNSSSSSQSSQINSVIANLLAFGPDYFMDFVDSTEFDAAVAGLSGPSTSSAGTTSATGTDVDTLSPQLTWDPNNLTPVYLAFLSPGALVQESGTATATSATTKTSSTLGLVGAKPPGPGLGLVDVDATNFTNKTKDAIKTLQGKNLGVLAFDAVKNIVADINSSRIEKMANIKKSLSANTILENAKNAAIVPVIVQTEIRGALKGSGEPFVMPDPATFGSLATIFDKFDKQLEAEASLNFSGLNPADTLSPQMKKQLIDLGITGLNDSSTIDQARTLLDNLPKAPDKSSLGVAAGKLNRARNDIVISASVAKALKKAGVSIKEGTTMLNAATQITAFGKAQMQKIQEEEVERDGAALLAYEKEYSPPTTKLAKVFFDYNEALFLPASQAKKSAIVAQLAYQLNQLQGQDRARLMTLMENYSSHNDEEIKEEILRLNNEYIDIYENRRLTMPGTPDSTLEQEYRMRLKLRRDNDIGDFLLVLKKASNDNLFKPLEAPQNKVELEEATTFETKALATKARLGATLGVGILAGASALSALSSIGLGVGLGVGLGLVDSGASSSWNVIFDKSTVLQVLNLKQQKNQLEAQIAVSMIQALNP